MRPRSGVADGSMSAQPPYGEAEVVEELLRSQYWARNAEVLVPPRVGLPVTLFRTTYFDVTERVGLIEIDLEPLSEPDEW